jgi:hypothetical protein
MPDIDWISGADASWYKRVLAVLQRDFPRIADEVWSRAIIENAAEQAARGEVTKDA